MKTTEKTGTLKSKTKKSSIKRKVVKKVLVAISTRLTDDPRGRPVNVRSERQKRLRHYAEMEKKHIPIRRGRYKSEILKKLGI